MQSKERKDGWDAVLSRSYRRSSGETSIKITTEEGDSYIQFHFENVETNINETTQHFQTIVHKLEIRIVVRMVKCSVQN